MKRTGLGRILWWAAPILLAVGIASRAADLREIAASLVGVKPGWVAAALVLGVLFTLNQGALYRAIFRLFDVRISLRESVRLALVMAFGSLAPAGTVAGIAYFVSTAREHGIPGPRAILTSLAFYLFDYGALLPVVAAGVTVLLTHHGAEVRLVTAGGIVLLITAAVGGALLWGLADGRALGTASRLASAINVLIARLHRRPVDRRRAAAWVADLRQIAIHLRVYACDRERGGARGLSLSAIQDRQFEFGTLRWLASASSFWAAGSAASRRHLSCSRRCHPSISSPWWTGAGPS